MAANVAFGAVLARIGFSSAAATILTDPAQENFTIEDLCCRLGWCGIES
jgi:hypothetical protein